MNRGFATVILVLLVMTIGAVPGHTQSPNRRFLGLWEGVDVNDGSKRTISITDRDGDRVFEVAARDTYWTLCDSDRGLETAAGGVRADGVLETIGLVTCFNGTAGITVRQTYELSRRDDTLYATPHGTSLLPITLHRVAGGREGRP